MGERLFGYRNVAPSINRKMTWLCVSHDESRTVFDGFLGSICSFRESRRLRLPRISPSFLPRSIRQVPCHRRIDAIVSPKKRREILWSRLRERQRERMTQLTLFATTRRNFAQIFVLPSPAIRLLDILQMTATIFEGDMNRRSGLISNTTRPASQHNRPPASLFCITRNISNQGLDVGSTLGDLNRGLRLRLVKGFIFLLACRCLIP